MTSHTSCEVIYLKKQEQEPKPHEVKDPAVPIVQGAEQVFHPGGRTVS